MKLLVCGAGRITDELLKRIGANWEISLIEKEEAKLAPFSNRFPNIVRVMAEDASSPVVLDKAGLADQDGVLALTNDDQINLAVARFARQADVKTVLAVVRDPEKLPDFQKMDVWTVSMATDAARKAYQILKDPRIRIVDLGDGEGELMAMTVEKQDVSRLTEVLSRQDPQWRAVGLLRENRLLFADVVDAIEAGDRLLILGKDDLYSGFASRLSENRRHFPRTYGQQMILGLPEDASLDVTELLNETFYLAQGTQVEKIKMVYETAQTGVREALARWAESLVIETIEGRGDLRQQVSGVAEESDAGIVVLPYRKVSRLRALFGGPFTALARALPCPLLAAKLSEPYEKLIVPFNDSLAAQRALEIAVDLARQLDAAVAAVVVVEPSYLRGESTTTGQWEQEVLHRVRELARINKVTIEEIVRRGNPVREIVAAAAGGQLLVVGMDERPPGWFSVDVTSAILNKASCSVLLVA
ncbi:MAG: NAD-binding protein [Desulfobacterales bacterium]|nr:NAD-binding protein [Desulfobacterales bacterium]